LWSSQWNPPGTRRSRHRKLKTAELLIPQSKTVADVCHAIEFTQPTYHRWKHQYCGIQAEEDQFLMNLEKENAHLKKPLAEAELEKAMLRVPERFACGVVC
tara:strand:+ start:125 stop:427 length:303 start_codon:yes stop_codon:yes gene_type:complete